MTEKAVVLSIRDAHPGDAADRLGDAARRRASATSRAHVAGGDDDLLTIEEAASLTRRSPFLLRFAVASGVLPAARVGRTPLLRRSDVVTWATTWRRLRQPPLVTPPGYQTIFLMAEIKGVDWTVIYRAIRCGQLAAEHDGRQFLVRHADARAWQPPPDH